MLTAINHLTVAAAMSSQCLTRSPTYRTHGKPT